MKRLALLVVLVCLFCCLVEGKRVRTKYQAFDDQIYMNKFTYSKPGGSESGQFNIDVKNVAPQIDAVAGRIFVNTYTNEEGMLWYFPDIWHNASFSCSEDVALQLPGSNIIVNGTILRTQNIANTETLTYFYVVSDCDIKTGQFLMLDVELHWTNEGSWWYKEFSVEDQDLLTIYFIFGFFWIILCPATFFLVYKFFIQQNRELDHNMFFFLLSVVFQTIAMVLYVLHYITYAGDGVGIPGFLVGADVLTNLATLFFMLVLIQVASLIGNIQQLHTVTWGTVGVSMGCYFTLFLWQEIYPGLYPTVIAYKWDCFPGVLMILFQLLIWVFFLTLCLMNAARNADRRVFLAVFGGVFSVWFLSLPFMATVATGIAYYHRYKIVLGLTETVNLLCVAFFLFLAIPSPLSNKINAISFSHRKKASDIVENSILDESNETDTL